MCPKAAVGKRLLLFLYIDFSGLFGHFCGFFQKLVVAFFIGSASLAKINRIQCQIFFNKFIGLFRLPIRKTCK